MPPNSELKGFKMNPVTSVGGGAEGEGKKPTKFQKIRVLIAEIWPVCASRLLSVSQKDNASFPHPVHKECCLQTAITERGGEKGNEWIICLSHS